MILGFFTKERIELLDVRVDQEEFFNGKLELEDLNKALTQQIANSRKVRYSYGRIMNSNWNGRRWIIFTS